jgi:hypothetical protein
VTGATGSYYVGDLVGYSGGTVEKSYATGTVTGGSDSEYVGGLVGVNSGTVETSYATGAVSGITSVGGLVGENSGGTIETSYATGPVTGGTGSNYVGGLAGLNQGIVETCYATGAVSGNSDVGGLVGYNGVTVETSYWAQDTGLNVGLFGIGDSSSNTGATPETIAALEQQSTFQPAGTGVPNWDFTNTWTTDGNTDTPQLIGLPMTPPPTGASAGTDLLSGTAYTDSGVTISPDTTIDFVFDGSLIGSTTTSSSGSFSFNITSGDLTGGVLLTDPADHGNTFYQANSPAATIGGIDIWGNTLRLMGDTASTAALGQAAGSLSGAGINYTVNGTFLSTNAGVDLNILSNYALDGVVAANNITVNSALSNNTSDLSVLSAYGNITINASVTNSGGGGITLISDQAGTGVGTVAFNNGAQVSTAGAVDIFYNPSVNPAGSAVNATSYVNPTENYAPDVTGGATLTAYMLVNTLNDLQNVQNNLSGTYALSQNIDASPTSGWNGGAGFVPIGNTSTNFTGIFNGQGYTINNLTINLPSGNYVGLFGYAYSGSILENVGLVDDSVSGNAYVGGLVGVNSGTVETSYATGAVTGGNDSYFVGGLVGYNDNLLQTSYATGAVTGGSGSEAIGGLVGLNYGTVETSYAIGAVTGGAGSTEVGGLVGQNSGTVETSYATGAVSGVGGVGGLVGYNNSTVETSYWAQDTGLNAGLFGIGNTSSNAGATPETIAALEQQATFQPAGLGVPNWDFTNTWTTDGNTDTPQLIGLPMTAPPTGASAGTDLLSGTAYTDSGLTLSADTTIDLLFDGSFVGSTTTSSSGSFSFNLTSGDLTGGVLLTDPADHGNTFFQANSPASSISGVDLWGDTLRVQAQAGSNTALGQAAGSLTGYGVNYAVSGTNLSTNSGVNMLMLSGTGYTLDGNITSSGSFTTATGSVLSGTSNVTVTGSAVALAGTFNTSGSLDLVSTAGEVNLTGVGTSASPATAQGLTLNAAGSVVVVDSFLASGGDDFSASNSGSVAGGIIVSGSTINAQGGAISLIGTGGLDGDDGTFPVTISNDAINNTVIETSGTGNITIQGTFDANATIYGGELEGGSSGGFSSFYGVSITGGTEGTTTTVSVAQGTLLIDGTISQATYGDGTTAQNSQGGFTGVYLAGATIQATGSGGAVSVTGNTSGTTSFDNPSNGDSMDEGIVVAGNSAPNTIISVGTNGTLTLNGTGGTVDSTFATSFDNSGTADGIEIDTLTQVTGGAGATLSLTGNGGSAITDDGNTAPANTSYSGSADGLSIGDDQDQGGNASVTVGTGGSISMTGTAGSMNISNDAAPASDENPDVLGLHIKNGSVITADGTSTITLHGTGGTVTAGSNDFGSAIGVSINSSKNGENTLVSSDSGLISIMGTGGSAPNQAIGAGMVGADGGTVEVESTSGDISATGIGGGGYAGTGSIVGTSVPSSGVVVADAATLMTGGAGTISFTGTGGSHSRGVVLLEITGDPALDTAPVVPVIDAGGAFTANALSGTGIYLNGTLDAASATLGAETTAGNPATISSGRLEIISSNLTLADGNLTAYGTGYVSSTDANATPNGITVNTSMINAQGGSISLTGNAGYDLGGTGLSMGDGVVVDSGSVIETSAAGNISVTAIVNQNITSQTGIQAFEMYGASNTISVATGTISITGNVLQGTAAGTATDGATVQGIEIGGGSTVAASGTGGSISLTGDVSGGKSVVTGANFSFISGIEVSGDSSTPDTLSVGTTGSITLNGTGGTVDASGYTGPSTGSEPTSVGVSIDTAAQLTGGAGSTIGINGTEGAATANTDASATGVEIDGGVLIQVAGTGGTIQITGDASASTVTTASGNGDEGMEIGGDSGVACQVAVGTGGSVSITGTGGTLDYTSTGDFPDANGLQIDNGAQITAAGTSTLTLHGMGGTVNTSGVASSSFGINIGTDASTDSSYHVLISTVSGALDITGTGGTSPDAGAGIFVSAQNGGTTTLQSGSGTITLTGTGGAGNSGPGTFTGNYIPNVGVALVDGSTIQTTNGAAIDLIGTGGSNNAPGVDINGATPLSGDTMPVAPIISGTGALDLNSLAGSGIIYDAGSLAASSATFNSTGTVLIGSAIDNIAGPITIHGTTLTLNAGIAATGGNTVLVDTTQFVNNAGANALTASNGYNWQVWSVNPPGSGQGTVDNDGGLTPNFIQYGATYGTTTPAASGNGLLYSYAPAPLALALTGTFTKTYDGSLNLTIAANSYGFSSSGLVSGDTLGVASPTTLTGTLNSKDVLTANTVTVTPGQVDYDVTRGGVPVYGYTVSAVSASASVTPATLTASLNGTVDKVYDSTTAAILTGSNYNLPGVISGDTVTLNDPASGTYDTKDAGTGKTVTVTGLALSGAQASDYVLDSTTIDAAVGTITAATLTASLTGTVGKVYDSTTAASLTGSNYNLTGVFNGDTVTLNDPVSGTYDTKDVGTGKTVTVTGLALTGGQSGDYVLASTSANAAVGTVTPATLTAGLTGTVAKTYDGSTAATLATSNYTLTGVYSGDTVSLNDPTAGTYDTANAGTGKTVTVTGLAISGTSAGDYTLASTAASGAVGTIDAAGVVIAYLTGTISKVYDDSLDAINLTSANYALSGVVPGDTVIISGPTTGTYASKDVGSGIMVTSGTGLTLSGPQASNYTLGDTQASGMIGIITPAPVTAGLAGTVGKVYDSTTAAALAAANYTLTGVYNGDDATLNDPISGLYDTKDVGTGKTVSVTGLALSGAQADDYMLTSTSASGTVGTITPASLMASLTGTASKVYDSTTSATVVGSNLGLTGLFNGDDVAVGSSISGTYDTKDVGTGKTVTVTGLTLSGPQATDYTLDATTVSGAIGTITPATLTASLTGTVSKVYDSTTAATLADSNYNLAGLYDGDAVILNNPVSGTYDTKDVGTGKTVSVTGLALSGNSSEDYILSNTSATGALGVITPATLTATLTGTVAKVYDGTVNAVLNFSNISLAGIFAGDSLSGAGTGTYDTSNVGSEKTVTPGVLTLTGASASDYQLSSQGPASAVIGAITPATLVYVADPVTVAPGATLPGYTGTVTGFVTGDNLVNATTGTLTFTSLVTDSNTVGSYAIDGNGLSAGNYTFTQAQGNATALTIGMVTPPSNPPSTATGGAASGGSNIVPPVLTPQPVQIAQQTNPATSNDSTTSGNGNTSANANGTQQPPFSFAGTGDSQLLGELQGGLADSASNNGQIAQGDTAQMNSGQLNSVANPEAASALNEALGPIVYQNLSDALKTMGDWADVPEEGNGTEASGGDAETILTAGDVAEVTGSGAKKIPLSQAPEQLRNAMNGDALKGMGLGH